MDDRAAGGEERGSGSGAESAPRSKLHDRLNLAAIVVTLGFLVYLFVLFADSERELPVYWEAPEFALVHQQGDTLRTADLRGTPWVASFVFTNCTSVCPVITQRMAGLRDSLAAEGVLGEEVRLVSFTVDPARDTPEVLREYAGRFGGSPPAEWAFLTGTPPEAVRTMIQEGFKLTASVPQEHEHGGGNYQVMHSPRLVLVDGEGRVRGLYDTTEPDALELLDADLRALLD
jgi:protein SCO1/2